MHPRLKKHRKDREDRAINRMLNEYDRPGLSERYAHLLHHGHANLDTIRELNEVGRRLGKSPEQIELDARTLHKETAGTAG